MHMSETQTERRIHTHVQFSVFLTFALPFLCIPQQKLLCISVFCVREVWCTPSFLPSSSVYLFFSLSLFITLPFYYANADVSRDLLCILFFFAGARDWRKCERSAKKRAGDFGRISLTASTAIHEMHADVLFLRRDISPTKSWCMALPSPLALHLRGPGQPAAVDNRVLHVFRLSAPRDDIFQPGTRRFPGIRSMWNFRLTLNAEASPLRELSKLRTLTDNS